MAQLPPNFQAWFDTRGWSPHPHQLALLERSNTAAILLIAPTGGGKTLSGFLPSLVELADNPKPGLHTLYISPLKALAADIRRNLQSPVEELHLPIRVEDRTGDTKQSQRLKQRKDPPHILLTTPESLALLLSYEDSPYIFNGLRRIVVDEIHALHESKRGDQLMLCLSRLKTLAPQSTRIGLSATIEDPAGMAEFLSPGNCEILHADPGPDPDISLLETTERPPWTGMGGAYAARAVMDKIREANTTLVFINTRAQAELFFQALWAENTEDLPIGLHHGSLSREVRERVEAAMVAGQLRAIVCTGSLDLGIDWGNVDLVIQVGAPKNVKRLVQRIGRSNHRYNAPSRAILVPANRFELIECRAALEAVQEHDLDGEPRGPGPLDVLCQHILLTACAGPFDAETLFVEIRNAGPYRVIARQDFDDCLQFCATGGYALRAYDRWQRLLKNPQGLWHLRDPRAAKRLRMNIGTIVDVETLVVRLRGRFGNPLGEVEENFAASLSPGDTFLIGGEVVRYEGLRDMVVEVSRSPTKNPKIAVFSGTRLAMSTKLSHRVQRFLADPAQWNSLPDYSKSWLSMQAKVSHLPRPDRILAETFERGERAFFCLYGFAGRNAHQTLGLILTRRMEQANLEPIGFVTNDYAILIWSLQPVLDVEPLLDPQGLRDGLETWLASNAVMKRTFRASAIIAGLIEKNLPGLRKSGRQATFSSDILYDTLRKYDPNHLMLRVTKIEALRGLVDFERIEEMLTRSQGRIDHVIAPHLTPLAAPLLFEIGKVPVKGRAQERLMAEEALKMMAEAGLT